MAEPVSMSAAALTAMSEGGKQAGSYFAAREQAKAEKKKAKEMKRKTLAELLNAALGREFDAGEGIRKRGTDLALGRAGVLQNIASQYVQSSR